MSLYIYQHLGLGDMIANNALVRYLIKLNKKKKFFYIFCKQMHLNNVNFMYRDLRRINLISVPNDPLKEKKFVSNPIKEVKEFL